MFNSTFYTGTGLVVAGLGAAYYALSNRAAYYEIEQARRNEIHRRHEISALEDAELAYQDPPAIFRSNFEELKYEAGDPADIDSVEISNLPPPMSSPPFVNPPSSYGDRRINSDYSDEAFEEHHVEDSYSSTTLLITPSISSQRFLKTSLHSLNVGCGAKEGLNVASDKRNNTLVDPIRKYSTRKFDSLCEVRQIVSRTQLHYDKPLTNSSQSLTSPTSGNLRKDCKRNSNFLSRSPTGVEGPTESVGFKRPKTRRGYDAGEAGQGRLATIFEEEGGNLNSNSSSQSVFGMESDSNFELYVENVIAHANNGNNKLGQIESKMEESCSGDNSNEAQQIHKVKEPAPKQSLHIDFIEESYEDAEESLEPSSPVIYYSNPRFGERYACKYAEGMTASAMLKNSKMTDGKPSRSKIPRRIKQASMESRRSSSRRQRSDPPKADVGLKSCSTTEKFQQILQEKKARLRPVGLSSRKSEGMIIDINNNQNNSSMHCEDENNDGFALGHKDSTLFLFPPVLSDSRFSLSSTEPSSTNVVAAEENHEENNQIHGEDSGFMDEYNCQLEHDMTNTQVSDSNEQHRMMPSLKRGYNNNASEIRPTKSATHRNIKKSSSMKLAKTKNSSPETPTGLVNEIPSNSWINFLIRLLPFDFFPYGLLFCLPLIVILLACFAFILSETCRLILSFIYD